jgi:hypothetical protein
VTRQGQDRVRSSDTVASWHFIDSDTCPCYTTAQDASLGHGGAYSLLTDLGMNDLLRSISQLTVRKKLVVVVLLLLIVLTWLGVCAVLGSYLV